MWILFIFGLCVFFAIFFLHSFAHSFIPGPSASPDTIDRLENHTVIDGGEPSYSIHYYSAGSPDLPRLILVHGTPGNAEGWADYIVKPIEGFHVIAYDRPGFGLSDPDGPVVSLSRQAKAIEPFLVPCNGRLPVLVGHSLGGPVAVQAALDFPDKISGLIILAGSMDPALEKIRWWQNIARYAPIRWILPRPLLNGLEELVALKQELLQMSVNLHKIICPVVIVQGDEDRLVPPANARYMENMFTSARFVKTIRLKNQNHYLPWNNRKAVEEAVHTLQGHL